MAIGDKLLHFIGGKIFKAQPIIYKLAGNFSLTNFILDIFRFGKDIEGAWGMGKKQGSREQRSREKNFPLRPPHPAPLPLSHAPRPYLIF
ncbi:MAG: hypothetical protein V7K64_03865 [Nostoc sp.]|uniref:hypothetical protein n=1 Tax=unclassified Nostoc TaxID=2593658 RepID=UPI001DF6E376|nr:hypothetical protein [Nostoc sp. JL34]MBN3886117.1 hypothetical protein [Nostoc sp. JL34]